MRRDPRIVRRRKHLKTFRRVPAHFDILGNEKGDKRAKDAIKKTVEVNFKLPKKKKKTGAKGIMWRYVNQEVAATLE